MVVAALAIQALLYAPPPAPSGAAPPQGTDPPAATSTVPPPPRGAAPTVPAAPSQAPPRGNSVPPPVGSQAGAPELPPPPNQQQRIQFPLEKRHAQSNPNVPPPPRDDLVVELRDPFEVRSRNGRSRKTLNRRLLLPDLKDPFAFKHGLQPKAWVQLPGDIRNPFSPNLERMRKRSQKGGCLPPEQTTQDGVVIQQTRTRKRKSKSVKNCRPSVPLDLRDPFKA